MEAIKIVQNHANNFFQEYQNQSKEQIMADLVRWESAKETIFGMTIEQQSTYADYVTKKMAKLDDDILQPFIIHTLIECLESSFVGVNACAIGNVALLILSMNNDEEQQKAKNKFSELLK